MLRARARVIILGAFRGREGVVKPHYFEQESADQDDHPLGMAKMQGYVPETCLLSGAIVMSEVRAGRHPCWECNGPRERCGGKPKRA